MRYHDKDNSFCYHDNSKFPDTNKHTGIIVRIKSNFRTVKLENV